MLALKKSWEEIKEKIKESNIELTDEDLLYDPGQESKLLKHLAQKMKRSPEEIQAWIESVSSTEGKAS
ncbi:MAG: general stress protein CsbD [Bacteroidota bacterium]|nr:general stress protein CsbD [Bacteroidota bacterium]